MIEFIKCDVTSWSHLRDTFRRFDRVDMVFANAGISETDELLEDVTGSDGLVAEPEYKVLDVNFRAVLNMIKLSYRVMKGQEEGGSIVLTSSATAYAPERCLPVYSATKLAVRQASSEDNGITVPDYNIDLCSLSLLVSFDRCGQHCCETTSQSTRLRPLQR